MSFNALLDELDEMRRRAAKAGKTNTAKPKAKPMRKGGFTAMLQELDTLQKASRADQTALASVRRDTRKMLKAHGVQESGPRELMAKAMEGFRAGLLTAEDVSKIEATCHRIFK